MAEFMFNRKRTRVNGVFSSDKAKLLFVPVVPGLSGILVQGLNFNYAQQVTKLFEVGMDANFENVYYVGGRTQGSAQISRVIGPNATIVAFYEEYGDVCKSCNKSLSLNLDESNCCATANSDVQNSKTGLSFKLVSTVITQMGVSLNAQDMMINENTQLMFSGLEYESIAAAA